MGSTAATLSSTVSDCVANMRNRDGMLARTFVASCSIACRTG